MLDRLLTQTTLWLLWLVRQVISMVEAVSERTVPVQEAARRPGDAPELVAACAKAREVLGWSAQHSDLRNIVSSAWRWHSSRSAPTRAAAAAD